MIEQMHHKKVKNLLMEESNVQFVRSPVTVIHEIIIKFNIECRFMIHLFCVDLRRHSRTILRPFGVI